MIRRLIAALALISAPAEAQTVTNGAGTWPHTPITAGDLRTNLSGKLDATGGQAAGVQVKPGTVWRTNEDLLNDQIWVKSYGAVCDGTTDDSAAFQASLNAAASQGKTLRFGGTCRVNAALTLPSNPTSFSIDGSGGTIKTNGNSLWSFATTSGMTSGFRVQISNFSVVNTGAQGGTAILLDNTNSPINALGQPNVHDVNIKGMQIGLSIVDVSDATADNMLIDVQGTSATSEGVHIEGTDGANAKFAVNGRYRAITVLGGYGFHLVGAIQGVNITDSKGIVCTQYGIKTDSEYAGQGIQILNGYWEGVYGGISITNWAGVQIIGNSFDAVPTGINANWHAVYIGAAGTTVPFGVTIQGSNVMGFGAAKSPPFMLTMNGGDVSGNVVFGNAPDDQSCMNVTSPAENSGTRVHDNMCWAAGGYVYGGSVIGLHNVWTGASNNGLYSTGTGERATCPSVMFNSTATCWNQMTGSGETDFVNAPGQGTGLFAWWVADKDTGVIKSTPVMTLDGGGTLSVSGNIYGANNIYTGLGKSFITQDGSGVSGYVATDAYGGMTFGTLKSGAVAHTVTSPVTVASLKSNLPCSASTGGFRAEVSDASSPSAGAALVGGGSKFAPAFCDGTNWIDQ